MPLPANKGRAETVVAGGTTVASESQLSLWLGLAALAIVVGGVAYLSTRGEAKQPVPVATTAADGDPNQPVAPRASQPDDGEVGFTGEEAPPTEDELREQAIVSFRSVLQEKRLWSTISIEGGTTLSLVSGACSDAAMRPTISTHAKSLSRVGFSRIRCLEKHGEQVFEQGL